MTDEELREFMDRLIRALEDLSSTSMSGWEIAAVLIPSGAILAALFAAGVAWMTLRHNRKQDEKDLAHRQRADDRSEWWTRTQWALDRWNSENLDPSSGGALLLAALIKSKLADQEDKDLLRTAWKAGQGELTDTDVEVFELGAGRVEADDESPEEPGDATEPAEVDVDVSSGDNEGTREEDLHHDR